MKWRVYNSKPEPGEFRFKTRFAWIPTSVTDYLTKTKYVVWLEWYEEESRWTVSRDPACTGWRVCDKFIYISKYPDTL